jgi:hypothetical protein
MTRKTPTIGGRPKADHKSCATRFVQPRGNRVFGNPDCPPNRGGRATREIRPPCAPTTCRSSLFSEPDLANPGPRFISSPRQQTVVMLTAPRALESALRCNTRRPRLTNQLRLDGFERGQRYRPGRRIVSLGTNPMTTMRSPALFTAC